MRINGTGADVIRPDQAREIQRSQAEGVAKKATAPQPSAPAQRSDKVEISDAARKLAQGVDGASSARGDLAPERVALIREKILAGAYNSLDVVEQVAKKMLESGDI